jgi:hypothetical protein
MSAAKTMNYFLAAGALLAASFPAFAHHDPRHGGPRPGHPVFDRGSPPRHVVVEHRPRHIVVEQRPRHVIVQHHPVQHLVVERRRPKTKRHVVVERPVYIERQVVVEQPVYIERRPAVVHAPAPVVYGPPPPPVHGVGVNVVGAAAGAAIGAVIGSQIGHGRDRAATTAAGAAIGGVIGSQF